MEVTTNSDYSREQFEVSHDKGLGLAQAGLELYDLGWSQTTSGLWFSLTYEVYYTGPSNSS